MADHQRSLHPVQRRRHRPTRFPAIRSRTWRWSSRSPACRMPRRSLTASSSRAARSFPPSTCASAFGFERAPIATCATRLLVVQAAGRSVGLLVDACREFLTIPVVGDATAGRRVDRRRCALHQRHRDAERSADSHSRSRSAARLGRTDTGGIRGLETVMATQKRSTQRQREVTGTASSTQRWC